MGSNGGATASCSADTRLTSTCITEGNGVPVVLNPSTCCSGLTLIRPLNQNTIGSSGICTAKCGNGTCDSATENNYNCPQDCPLVSAQPSIRITYPTNTTTSLIAGNTYAITWTSSNIPSTAQCDIGYYAPAAATPTPIATITNTGSYQWAIPSNIPLTGNSLFAVDLNCAGTDKYSTPFIISVPMGCNSSGQCVAGGTGGSCTTSANCAIAPVSVSCSSNPSSVQVGGPTTFTATASGGTGSYNYSWSGACTGTSQTCSNSFSTYGTQTATVVVTSGSQTSSASCNATSYVPGGCGTAAKNYSYYDGSLLGTWCAVGSPTPAIPAFPAPGASSTWTCLATSNGGTTTCTATRNPASLVNGACGSANGIAFTAVPTSNLCSTGTASTPSGSGPWTWTCAGVSGGADASCSATIAATVPAPTITITATPLSIAPGETSHVTWSSTNATSCVPTSTPSNGYWASNPPSAAISSAKVGYPNGFLASSSATGINSTTTFTLTCTGPGGTVSGSATVTVVPTSVGANISQSSLASISEAIANILAEIKAMLNK